MDFYTWMMKKHLRTMDPVGDLARDMQPDKEFPRDGNKEEIEMYLETCGACSGCMDAFNKAWRKYERAPLRVAKTTWPEEIKKWEHLRGLRFSVAVGTAAERLKALQADADIFIINRENVPWLIEQSGIPFDFDMVVVDELSSFKSWQSKRFRALMKVRPSVR